MNNEWIIHRFKWCERTEIQIKKGRINNSSMIPLKRISFCSSIYIKSFLDLTPNIRVSMATIEMIKFKTWIDKKREQRKEKTIGGA